MVHRETETIDCWAWIHQILKRGAGWLCALALVVAFFYPIRALLRIFNVI